MVRRFALKKGRFFYFLMQKDCMRIGLLLVLQARFDSGSLVKSALFRHKRYGIRNRCKHRSSIFSESLLPEEEMNVSKRAIAQGFNFDS